MNCALPLPDPSKRLADLERKARSLDARLALFHELTGIPTDQTHFVVALLSSDYAPSTGKFTVVWVSDPGFTYQVQSSTDAVTWVKEDNVEAAEDAVQTEWLSDSYELGDLPVYFRVLRYPSAMPICTPE